MPDLSLHVTRVDHGRCTEQRDHEEDDAHARHAQEDSDHSGGVVEHGLLASWSQAWALPQPVVHDDPDDHRRYGGEVYLCQW
jgi:hypothetical protein